MALDLLVNFERYSNNSVFYRTTGSFPLSVKLVDTTPTSSLSSISDYDVRLSINGINLGNQIPDTETGLLSAGRFNTTTASVCSISAAVYLNQQFVTSFAMSAVFVTSFPTIDIKLYPSSYINQVNFKYYTLNEDSFEDSPGVFFYGEGHTQDIMLSCTGYSSPTTGVWLVGNEIDNTFQTSVVSVSTSPSTKFGKVSITSSVGQTTSYPVSLRLYNTTSKILLTGPVITYPDTGGAPEFYSFFASTMTPLGIDRSLTVTSALTSISVVERKKIIKNLFKLTSEGKDPSPIGRWKGNIKVLEYPETFGASKFISPFGDTEPGYILLASDQKPKPFRGYLYKAIPDYFVTTKIGGSEFKLDAISEDGSWSIRVPVLSSIRAYQFNLAYDTTINDEYLPPFTASTSYYTTLTLNTSCYKTLQIKNLSAAQAGVTIPTDWMEKTIVQKFQNKGFVSPLPTIRLFTPNFYYLRDQLIPITLVGLPVFPFTLKQAVITSKFAKNSITLTEKNLKGSLQIPAAGFVDLIVNLTVSNITDSSSETFTIIFDDYIRVVNSFDYVNEDLYTTALTPLTLTYNTQPKLSPNEWAIADNVNSIIEKMYTVIDDLDDYTKLYTNYSKLYAWLGPENKQSIADYKVTPKTWEQISRNNSCNTWISLSSTERNDSLSWYYNTQYTTQKAQEPGCFQDYCLSWKWISRKKSSGSTQIRWRFTKKNTAYQKHWKSNRICDVDTEFLNCNIGKWKLSTMDLESFPIPFNSTTTKCYFTGALYFPKVDGIIYTNFVEANLIKNDKDATWIARRSIADDTFSFQNLAGISSTKEGRLIVLDNILCKVSVYDVISYPAEFKLFSSWGTFGGADSPRGFKTPQDIHVDQNDSLYVVDTGNKRIKKLSIVGKHIATFYYEAFEQYPPLSVCVDSKLQMHCLTSNGVYVLDSLGNYLFMYSMEEGVTGVKKINTSYNRESVYITYATGVVKYFRTGKIAFYIIKDYITQSGDVLTGYTSITQDLYRNCYVTVKDKILKIPDLQLTEESKAPLPTDLYWNLNDLLIHKEEYIQPWVYLKSFHRLWDNIELIRSSLAYEPTGCKIYRPPTYSKSQLVIGQNEIVTNATINRLSEQLWENLSSVLKYFDPDCKK